MGGVGRGPVKKKVLGAMGRSLDSILVVSGSPPLAAHQFSKESQKEIWMLCPILSIKSESLGVGSWALTFFFTLPR